MEQPARGRGRENEEQADAETRCLLGRADRARVFGRCASRRRAAISLPTISVRAVGTEPLSHRCRRVGGRAFAVLQFERGALVWPDDERRLRLQARRGERRLSPQGATLESRKRAGRVATVRAIRPALTRARLSGARSLSVMIAAVAVMAFLAAAIEPLAPGITTISVIAVIARIAVIGTAVGRAFSVGADHASGRHQEQREG